MLPLSGIKVLDFSQVFAGPLMAMMLADQGAEVIKVEPPEGDSTRHANPSFPNVTGMSCDFVSFNRNKRSIVVDITKSMSKTLTRRLCQWADVMIINTRVGARQRRSISYEDIAAINPALIYVSITGYGESGPDADLQGNDVAIQARVGDTAGRRLPGGAMPAPTRLVHFDMASAMLGAYAVTLALRERDRTGLGQKIELNLLHTALACQMRLMTRLAGSNQEGRPILAGGMQTVYQCGDGRYIFATMGREGGVRAVGGWDDFCAAVGLAELATDERFDTPEKRSQRTGELGRLLAAHFATRAASEWESRLKSKGFGVSILKDVLEVYEDPQVVANQMIVQYQQPGIGSLSVVNVPFKLSGTAEEERLRLPVPYIGEHTLRILEQLGFTQQEIVDFQSAGVTG